MKTKKSKTINVLGKEILYVAKKHTANPPVYIVYSLEKRKTKPLHIWVCICACACIYDYTTEKYKRKMCYHQKNNSNVKTFEGLKSIKESYDLLPINF